MRPSRAISGVTIKNNRREGKSQSETLLLFFGIHMANAATLAARQLAKEEAERQKQRQRARA